MIKKHRNGSVVFIFLKEIGRIKKNTFINLCINVGSSTPFWDFLIIMMIISILS